MRSPDAGMIHIIGAGLAGLAAAVQLADRGDAIAIHEATAQAGGRCRSYQDQATGMLIDNGTHLLLSGNRAAMAFTEAIGSRAGLFGPAEAEFPFIDLASDEQWKLRLGDGRFPWWVLDKDRRVPQTGIIDYLPLARLAWPSEDSSIGDVMNCSGPLYDRLLGPLLLAALNIEPRGGSAKLASALIRETFALSGQACRPLLARDGIGNVFVQPAIEYLRQRGVSISFEDELHSMQFSGARATQLDFAGRQVSLEKGDTVILAVPPYVASKLVPHLQTPTAFCGIVNAHFRADAPAHLPAMLGVVNGTCQWIFALPGRVSVTISDAGHLFDQPREQLARTIWSEVARIARLPEVLPPWQLVRERRATFAATPAQNVLRPAAQTAWDNLFLAGDWTATGLPATIESAIRSGNRAAGLARHRVRAAA
jgi:squalene-associated FAD-dependent desaturase